MKSESRGPSHSLTTSASNALSSSKIFPSRSLDSLVLYTVVPTCVETIVDLPSFADCLRLVSFMSLLILFVSAMLVGDKTP